MSAERYMDSGYNWYPNATASCRILKIFGFWMLFDFIFGVLLNGFVLYMFAKYKDLRSPTNAFVASICICDLIACIFELPLPMIANFNCKWIFGRPGCFFEGFVAYFVGCSSMYTLTLVSIDRYTAIVKPLLHQKLTYKIQFFIITACWVIGLFWAGIPLLGWSRYTMEGALTSCSVEWREKSANVVSYNILMFVFVLVVPVAIIIVFNWKLYIAIRNFGRELIWNSNNSNEKKKQEIEKTIARTSIFMIVGFIFVWAPYSIVAFISAFGDTNDITPIGATIPALFAKSQVVINPLIYVSSNKNYRKKLPFFNSRDLKTPITKYSSLST